MLARGQYEKVVVDRGQFSHYDYKDSIGHGSSGKVNKVQLKGLDSFEAMKIIPFCDDAAKARQGQQEIMMVQKYTYKYIVEVLDCFTDIDRLCFVMPLANCGNMQDEINRRKENNELFTEKEVLTYFTQICLALRCAHSQEIIHRNVKGQNALLHQQDGEKICMLADFGVVKSLSSETEFAKTSVGTTAFLSPEIINN